MAPHVGRIAFTIGLFVLILALISLPFLKKNSPEFIINLITIIISSLWLGFIIWSIRKETAVLRMKCDKNKPAGTKEEVNGSQKPNSRQQTRSG